MNKHGRKKNTKCMTISHSPKASGKYHQNISKFFIRQEENKPNYLNGLSNVSVLSSDDTALASRNLSSTVCKVTEITSDYKENCIKTSSDCEEITFDVSNEKNNKDEILNNDVTKKKSRKEKLLSQNTQVTDYFPVRRSNRRILLNAKKEWQSILEDAILSGKEEGFEIKEFPGKGRGVITKRPFKRGEFVLEYYGELIDYDEAKRRETVYATKENTGCYMYYFKFMNKRFCIDATKETHRLGRLVNHSKKGNLKTQPFFVKECPHLVLLACRDIEPGEELCYDYGDRRKVAVESHPWLAL